MPHCIDRSTAAGLISAVAILTSSIAKADVRFELTDYHATVWLSGEIKSSDARMITAFIDALPSNLARNPGVILDSSGGSVAAAMAIGRLLRKHQAKVLLDREASCVSSCTLVLAAATTRMVYGKVGVHRPYYDLGPDEERVTPKAIREMLDQVGVYLDEMNIQPSLFEMMVSTAPEDVRYLNDDEIVFLFPLYDPIFEESEVGRQAQAFGISTVEYRQRKMEADATCPAADISTVDGLEENLDCRAAVMWATTPTIYYERYSAWREFCDATTREQCKEHRKEFLAGQRSR